MDWDDKEERARFLEGIAGLYELHGKEPQKPLTKIYFFALARYDIEIVLQAMAKALGKSKFFPKPVEIIEIIEGKIESRAEVEALKVLDAMKTLSRTNAVVFDDPVTAAVVERGYGGWFKLASTHKEANDTWFVKDFRQRYAAFTEQGVQHVGVLAGEYGTENVDVALIGNAQKAQAALEAGAQQRNSQITMLTGGLKKQMALRA